MIVESPVRPASRPLAGSWPDLTARTNSPSGFKDRTHQLLSPRAHVVHTLDDTILVYLHRKYVTVRVIGLRSHG